MVQLKDVIYIQIINKKIFSYRSHDVLGLDLRRNRIVLSDCIDLDHAKA